MTALLTVIVPTAALLLSLQTTRLAVLVFVVTFVWVLMGVIARPKLNGEQRRTFSLSLWLAGSAVFS